MKRLKAGLVAGLILCTSAQAAELPARVEWARVAELSASVAGTVGQVHAQAGEAVRKDQELLTLEPVPFAGGLKAARARLKRAQAEHEMERQDMQRAQELYDAESLSTLQLDQARLELVRAEAELAQAETAVTRAEYRMGHATLRAPFDGWLLSVYATPGRHLSPGDRAPVVLRVAAAGAYLAVASSDAPATGWAAGSQVHVRLGDRRLAGELLPPALEAGPEGRYRVAARFEADAVIPAGTGVVLELP